MKKLILMTIVCVLAFGCAGGAGIEAAARGGGAAYIAGYRAGAQEATQNAQNQFRAQVPQIQQEARQQGLAEAEAKAKEKAEAEAKAKQKPAEKMGPPK